MFDSMFHLPLSILEKLARPVIVYLVLVVLLRGDKDLRVLAGDGCRQCQGACQTQRKDGESEETGHAEAPWVICLLSLEKRFTSGT